MTDAPSQPAAIRAGPVYAATSDEFRRIIQLSVVGLMLFLVLKTVALEPFGVPTGSMAPALYGNHRRMPCPRCGYPIVVGETAPDSRPVDFTRSPCTNCGLVVDLSNERTITGDRVVVDKSVYQARSPRRWEVSVFRCPTDQEIPYVKRVVGLPNEVIEIAQGEVYANGLLLRKTLKQYHELRVPIFDSNYAPEEGWGCRWLLEPLAGERRLPFERTGLHHPEDVLDNPLANILVGNELHFDALAEPAGIGLTYRHVQLDTQTETVLSDLLGYNGYLPDRKLFARPVGQPTGEPIHDFSVSFDLEIIAGTGTFACRLSDGIDSAKFEMPLQGNSSFAGLSLAPEAGVVPNVALGRFLNPAETVHVEIAMVDRTWHFHINGMPVVPAMELPQDHPAAPRLRQTSRPVQFGVRDASVVVRNFKIDRDLHYLQPSKANRAWQLGADEYFLLGDNTASSHDSRFWRHGDVPAPGIAEARFLGKPILIHQPMKPATFLLNGRLRMIQSPDWNRIRWMR